MNRLVYVLMGCGAVLASVAAAIRYLKLPQEYLWYAAFLCGIVVAIAAIVSLIQYVRNKKNAVAKYGPKVSQAELDHAARVRDVAATIKQTERHQKASAPVRPRLLAERLDPPWIAVLGLQGAGKTRLIGGPHPKKLPEIDHTGPVKGADASAAPEDRPRFFSAPGSAVYLEVPHALSHREDLKKSWEAELKLLARRPQPIHAVVLCVAADDLAAAADPQARAVEVGDLLAAEVHDLIANLQVHVPVHLVVTRLDRLSGFPDILGSLEQVSGPLGFELPDGRSEELALKEFNTRFDALCGWLDRRALRKLGEFREPDPPRQSRIYTFVQQVDALQEPLAAIAAKILAVRGGDPVRLRGVYLTSAAQDGEPVIDGVLENLARRTGGSYTPALPDPAPSRRIFTEELVTTGLVRDGGLARRTERLLQRTTVRRGVVGASLALVAMWIAVGTTGSAARNREMAQQTADASATVEGELAIRRRAPVEVAKITALRELLERWEDEAGVDPGDVRGWGLFRSEAIDPLRQFYKRAVMKGVVAVLRDKAEAELRDFAARFEAPDQIPEADMRTRQRDTLRFYLLVSGDKKNYERMAVRDAVETKFLGDTLRRRWSGGPRTGNTADYLAMELAVTKFLTLAADADFALPRDANLIAQVQEILKREDDVRAEVGKIVDEVSATEGLDKVNLRTLTGVADIENDGTEVRAAFTIEGWVLVKSRLLQANEDDWWVLGFEPSQAKLRVQRRAASLRTEYFGMYMEEWRRFIQRMKIVPPSSLDSGKQLMTELVRGRPLMPLSKVFAELKRHSELSDDHDYGDQKSLADFFSGKSKERGRRDLVRAQDVKAEFARLIAFAVAPQGKEGTASLDQYHAMLKDIRDKIGRALEDKAEEKPLVEALQRAIDDTKSLVQDGELDTWTAWTAKLLLTPLEELLRMLVRDQGTGAVADWCARIVDPMYERFDGRYPFVADSRSEVVVADFEEFFHPENGVIRKAREELLTSYVVLNGNTVELRDRGRSDGPKLDPGVVRFLNRAQDIGSVMFVNEELRVDFDLILACNPSVSRVEAVVEGKKVEFACGAERPTRLRWPSKEEHGASLTAFGKQGRKVIDSSGEWGLFQLLEKPPSTMPDFKGEEVINFRFEMAQYNLGQLDVRVKPLKVRGGTAFFGLPSGSKSFMALVRAPDVLPPKRLFANLAGCGN